MNNPFIFNKLNDFFDYLPFAEINNDLVVCLYCGNKSNFFLRDISKISISFRSYTWSNK